MADSTVYFAGDPRSNRERMLAGDLYIADDPENARRAQRAVQLANADVGNPARVLREI